MAFSFKRKSRLKSKVVITDLFSSGIRIKAYPVSLVYSVQQENTGSGLQVAFSAPKRILPSAVDRNRKKRQMKEAFRKNFHLIEKSDFLLEKSCSVMIIFQGKKELQYEVIENKIILLLERFKHQLSPDS